MFNCIDELVFGIVEMCRVNHESSEDDGDEQERDHVVDAVEE